MKMRTFNLGIVISFLIVFSLTLNTVNTFGQDSTSSQSQLDQKKKETLTKMKSILEATTYNIKGVKAIYKIAQKAKLNFDTYVYIEDLAHEFGYHTEPLIKIAQYASEAKVETNYFIQLADLVVMKLSETQQMVDLALLVSQLTTPTSKEIERKIKQIQETTDFKTMAEAKAKNKADIDKIRNKE
jgi:hypothetical protein